MSRAKKFDDSRDMAHVHMEQFQQELNTLRERLNEREQQLALLGQQSQGQVAQMQQQLNEVLARLDDREQEIAQLQIHMAEVPDFHDAPPPAANDDFARGRVPDIIKGLPQYNGSPYQLNTWIQSVERILKHFRSLANTDIFTLWLQDIRNKIVGDAGDMLASNGIPLDWPMIKAQLILMYGDKRELSTLLQKLFSLQQDKSPVAEFYSRIRDCFTGISTHIQTSQEWEKPAELVKFVDKLCLEKFVDGLEEPFATHVGLMQPITLNQAFQYAMDKANKIARKTGQYDVGRQHPKPTLPPRNNYLSKPSIPQVFNSQANRPAYNNLHHRPTFPPPVQRYPQNFKPNFQPYRPFNQPPNRQPYFQTNNQQQHPQQNQQRQPKFHQNFPSYRPPQQNPFPRIAPQHNATAEPMDVDSSIRSRNINYMNRPHYQVEEDYYTEYSYDQYPEYDLANETTNYEQENYEQPIDTDKPDTPTEDDFNFQLDTGTSSTT